MPLPVAIVGERRRTRFTENLSIFMAGIAALGAFVVLLEPKFVYVFSGGSSITMGGVDFSDQLKGLVIGLILVSGFTSVREYWLGQSATGQNIAESQSRIAEAAAPVVTALAAEAASTGLRAKLAMQNSSDNTEAAAVKEDITEATNGKPTT